MKQITETAITASFNVGSISASLSSVEPMGTPQSSCSQEPIYAHLPIMLIQLGHSRQDCLDYLASQGVDSIGFAHWLMIPQLDLLLVFRQQRCVAIEHYKGSINSH